MKKWILLSLLSSLVIGCGDSSKSTTPPSKPLLPATTEVSGSLISEPVKGALVFADINGNFQLDANEPSSLTDDSGAYKLSIPNSALSSTSVIALVSPDNTNTLHQKAVGHRLILTAPAGKYELSGFSIMLHQYQLEGLDEAATIKRLKETFDWQFDAYANYREIVADNETSYLEKYTANQLLSLARVIEHVISLNLVSLENSKLTIKEQLAIIVAQLDYARSILLSESKHLSEHAYRPMNSQQMLGAHRTCYLRGACC